MSLLLVDGTNVVMRWSHALLRDRQSEPTAEDIDRVCNSVEVVLRDLAEHAWAESVVVAMDSGKTWRHEKFPAYKSNRADGSGTAAWSTNLAAYLSVRDWRIVPVLGYEADDIIATLAGRAVDSGIRVSVFSSDSDLLQLVEPDACTVYQPGSKDEPRFACRSAGWIVGRYGISHPRLLPYWKALVGEPGDGLPGVRGIGPEKAKKLIREYPSPEDLLNSRALNSERRAEFELALDLATLSTNAPVPPLSMRQCRIPATWKGTAA